MQAHGIELTVTIQDKVHVGHRLARMQIACNHLDESFCLYPQLTRVSLVETGDSRIDKLTPVIADNAPKNRIDMIARKTDMAKPHHGKVESLL